MLFNSFEFLFAFLPVALLGFFLIGRDRQPIAQRRAILWLVVTSLFFYAWWNPANLALLGFSVIFNYCLSRQLGQAERSPSTRKLLLSFGIFVDLALIGYFKYANFFVDTVNQTARTEFHLAKIALPLAISFFTFQQIAYLVDTYRGTAQRYKFLEYTLVVTFFPHLIAGPIVRYQDILPQFAKESVYRFSGQCFSIGLTVFMAGLFKKMVFADRISGFANAAFGAAAQGVSLTFSEAWAGALSYALQLYFDFSGYSDMAIGLAYMFGIRFGINFDSPYKAISIIDFWRRWHITLSNFLRDYLYIPLGGSRQGTFRRHLNLMITMLLGGLWHGAGWTFVVWGGLHGAYLVINHQWRSLRRSLGHDLHQDPAWLRGMGWLTTFLAVVISWVIFRAHNLQTAGAILGAMLGMNGLALPQFLEARLGFLRSVGATFDGFTVNVGISQQYAVFGIAILLAIAWFTPNTQQWMGRYSPTLDQPIAANHPVWFEQFWQKLSWHPGKVWSAIVALLTAVSLLCFTRVSEFLYFQF
ncbi:MAG: MBOAT family protein [Drouetiella hepatica Uher 2000/2452]|jgi:D-alanyl-lipoteichoic acid acyltransferase DltB (MBOAT superfamily)|uniref:MBOAT family protein n=1 Tax=Drouetiella hepatica Uher 2000/2452 TaxID=904376 RepID=A0A951QDD3_9CYAN|nr:MBOAT family protein [Drouetiella hepatica Uher 2000/2452]